MHRIIKPELLDAMKQNLLELDNVKLIGPEDLEIIDQKRVLRQQITTLEKDDPHGYELVA
jgi:hypothetical protein